MYMCVVGPVHDGICIGLVVSITTSGLQINEHFSRKSNAFQASFIIVTRTYTFSYDHSDWSSLLAHFQSICVKQSD